MTKILKKQGEESYFICPACGKKQTTINEWQSWWLCYEMDLKTQDYEKGDMEEGNQDTQYCCPECGEEVDYDLIKQFYE